MASLMAFRRVNNFPSAVSWDASSIAWMMIASVS